MHMFAWYVEAIGDALTGRFHAFLSSRCCRRHPYHPQDVPLPDRLRNRDILADVVQVRGRSRCNWLGRGGVPLPDWDGSEVPSIGPCTPRTA